MLDLYEYFVDIFQKVKRNYLVYSFVKAGGKTLTELSLVKNAVAGKHRRNLGKWSSCQQLKTKLAEIITDVPPKTDASLVKI